MFVTKAYAQSAPAVGETHTETGVAHGAETTNGVFPPFDSSTYASQVLWLAITFGLFYVLMQKVIVPRVGGILENRHSRIAQDVDEAQRLNAEAQAAIDTYESELAAARSNALSIGTAAREAAKSKADAERAAVETELARKLADAEVRIAGVKQKAFGDVGTIAEETASAIVGSLLGTSAKESDVKAAVAAVSGAKGA
jgi:F-type H+-transporting ATPase subunit b